MDENEREAMLRAYAQALRGKFAALEAPGGHEVETQEFMLPMRDGAKMRCVLCKPQGAGPFPAILTRSSYPAQEPLHRVNAEEYASRGFLFMYSFCRGVGGSEGAWEPNVNERGDGEDTVNWLAARPDVRCIGLYGSSYLALTGWAVADILPDKVKTLYLTHYGTDRFTSAYQRGMFRQDVLTSWAMGNAGRPVDAPYPQSAAYRPHIRADRDVWGVDLPWYRQWITNTNRSDAYWREGFWGRLAGIPSRVKVPVYIGESWYDHHLGSALQTWRALPAQTRAVSQLRIGAWNHMFMPCVQGQRTERLENDDTATAFRWFTRILRDGLPPQSGVRVYRLGADEWADKPGYPFPKGGETRLYLASDGTLRERPDEAAAREYVYDPQNPVPSHGAEACLATLDAVGSLPQPGPDWRSDVLSFISEPFSHDVNILGAIRVLLRVASTAPDTAFTAKVMEVRPDGAAYNIRSGIATLAYPTEDTLTRAAPVTPGQVTEISIDMWDICWRVQKGRRLRVDISSSDFPQYSVHANLPGVWSLCAGSVPARQTVFCGGENASVLVLPLENDP